MKKFLGDAIIKYFSSYSLLKLKASGFTVMVITCLTTISITIRFNPFYFNYNNGNIELLTIITFFVVFLALIIIDVVVLERDKQARERKELREAEQQKEKHNLQLEKENEILKRKLQEIQDNDTYIKEISVK